MSICNNFGRLLNRCACNLALMIAAWSAISAAHAGAYEDFFLAVKLDNIQILKPLLEKGLNPNLVEPERGDTGLILALREDSMQAFKLLLAMPDIDIEVHAKNGDNALMIAAFKGNKPAVEALLKKGAEVNKPGWTALHYAAAVGNNDIVQMLLDRSAYIDAEAPNGTTPLMMAARGGHIYTVKLLHDSGADATLKNAASLTAIDFALQNQNADIAEGLTYRIARQEKKRKALEDARLSREERIKATTRMLQPVSLLPACMLQSEALEYYTSAPAVPAESARSAEPSEESRDDQD